MWCCTVDLSTTTDSRALGLGAQMNDEGFGCDSSSCLSGLFWKLRQERWWWLWWSHFLLKLAVDEEESFMSFALFLFGVIHTKVYYFTFSTSDTPTQFEQAASTKILSRLPTKLACKPGKHLHTNLMIRPLLHPTPHPTKFVHIINHSLTFHTFKLVTHPLRR